MKTKQKSESVMGLTLKRKKYNKLLNENLDTPKNRKQKIEKEKIEKVRAENIKSIKQKKYKTYRKQLKSEMFELENELVLNEFNDAVIECKIGSIENIFSRYDIAKNRSINNSFYEYLMQEVEIVPAKHDIELRMLVDENITAEQEQQIRRAIKTHYKFMITTANLILRRNAIVSTLLYLGGAATLLLNFLTDTIIPSLPIKEAMLISTWFLIWEATNKAFFERNDLNHDRYNMLRIFNAKIVFVKRPIQTLANNL